jgi:hypothetical protein
MAAASGFQAHLFGRSFDSDQLPPRKTWANYTESVVFLLVKSPWFSTFVVIIYLKSIKKSSNGLEQP